MKAMRWGIMGPGNIAHAFAKDLDLLDTPQTIQAVLGHTKKTTKAFAEEFAVVQQFSDLDEFIKNAAVDIVYISSPHTLHYEQAFACLENNIPVLCEKPMTINLVQCNELIKLSRQNKTFLMEGMWIRLLPHIQQLLYFIERGDIGRVVSLKASMGYKAPTDHDNRLFNPDLGGGSLLDLGIYPVFLALLLLGRPDLIKAIGTLTEEGVDEDCSILFQYKNRRHAILESTLSSQNAIPAEVTGEKGTIRILNPWFEKSAGLEIDSEHRGRVVYSYDWPGHGLHFEASEALRCMGQGKISSDFYSHEFSQSMISVMDHIRKQIHVTYEMYE